MVVKEEPTRLDEAIRVARQETDRQILGMKHHFQMVTNKVVDFEKEAESKSMHLRLLFLDCWRRWRGCRWRG
jgi:hypothetical protein